MTQSLTYASALLAAAALAPGCDSQDGADAGADVHDHSTHSHECNGYLVGPDGTAVLTIADPQHDGGAHAAVDAGPLATCVTPSADRQNGSGATIDGVYAVDARSLRGALSTDAPDHEGFALTLRRAGTALAGLTVRLYASMPQHAAPGHGAHGPANDPHLAGLAATAAGNAYAVDPVDFDMAGLWLFEARFSDLGAERRVYFSMGVTTGTP